MTGVRADKWLWAARFFKTRQIASKSCELGRIRGKNGLIKPSKEIQVGDVLQITTPGGEFEVTVLGLSDERGPASVAQLLYSESNESKERRRQRAEMNRMAAQIEVLPTVKPTGRDRRELDRFRRKDRY